MRTIWKYEFNDSGFREVDLGRNYKVILIASQHGSPFPTIWIEHNPEEEERSSVAFQIIGTGHVIPDDYEHIGSAICGAFVWHIYKQL